MVDKSLANVSSQRLSELTSLLQSDEAAAAKTLEREVLLHPDDARLQFLLGSVRASQRNYEGAVTSLTHAIAIDPAFVIARFQLGLLLLTAGNPTRALEVWGPLDVLPKENAIRYFVTGLKYLVRDEFSAAIGALQQGIMRNQDNPPLNRDMAMVIDTIKVKLSLGGSSEPESALSSAQALLRQASFKPTRH